MNVIYCRSVKYPDGNIKLYLKNSYVSDTLLISELKRENTNKFNNKLKQTKRNLLIQEYNQLQKTYLNTEIDRKAKLIEHELNKIDLDNRRRSFQRSKQELYDICMCNSFSYFVTVTFDDGKIDSYDDNVTRKAFSNFVAYLRQKYPSLYYVCVPEYQKRGVLHFHMLVGGVTMEQLGCVPAYDKKRRRYIFKHGKQIFNVTAWKKGFSTLSVIGNLDATRHYICKYLMKQYADERFLNKKRYYTSSNIIRPIVERWQVCSNSVNMWDIDPRKWSEDYFDPYMKYGVFSKKQYKQFRYYGYWDVSLPVILKFRVQGDRRQIMRKSLLSEFSDEVYATISQKSLFDMKKADTYNRLEKEYAEYKYLQVVREIDEIF